MISRQLSERDLRRAGEKNGMAWLVEGPTRGPAWPHAYRLFDNTPAELALCGYRPWESAEMEVPRVLGYGCRQCRHFFDISTAT